MFWSLRWKSLLSIKLETAVSFLLSLWLDRFPSEYASCIQKFVGVMETYDKIKELLDIIHFSSIFYPLQEPIV